MKIGIVGLPQTGKKTLFQLIRGYDLSERDFQSDKPLISVAEVKDPRFDFLLSLYNPKKEAKAKISVELLPKIEKDSIAKGDIFRNIADVDAVCHVVRAFEDDSVYHSEGTVDFKRDIYSVNSELILHDLVFVEKRLEKLEKAIVKLKDKDAIREKEVMIKLQDVLEQEKPARLASLDSDDMKVLSGYPLITLKKMIIALNVSEDDVNDDSICEEISQFFDEGIKIVQFCAKAEQEIAELDSVEDRREFMEALEIKEPAVNLLTRVCIDVLDQISFFTVGEDEVRQWLLKRGSTAPEAAGAIHSDLQKGFIRAEVMKFDELEEAGSEDKLKELGRFMVKGKDYIVEDGDILCIRFNV